MTFLGVANEKLILPNPQAFRIISEAKFNPLRANHTKWSNTHNSSAICRRIV